jgi:O-acetyl-ADP-ribose deacetylase (regulator of RNase III)
VSFEIIKGDLFDPDHGFDALAQGVNCQGLMGAGIAVPFRDSYPEMYVEYKTLCYKYRHILPGLFQHYVHVPAFVGKSDWGLNIYEAKLPSVYNLFSQIQPGPDGSYELLQRATFLMLKHAEEDAEYSRVGMPWIGCGIAGLERHNVEHIFRELLTDSDIEFVLVEQ